MIIENISTYNINDIKHDEFVIYHHLGLGDHIICNGIVNHFSKLNKRIHLVVRDKFYKQVKHMYSENKKLNLLSVNPVGINDANKEVEEFALKMNLQILKIGFEAEKKINKPFYKSFYKQLSIPYRYSYSNFYIPDNFDLENTTFEHLLSHFGIKNEKFGVFHNEASDSIFDLDINSSLPLVSLSEKYDLFNNIFLYKKILYEADEIHCINSSFAHFIDRVNTKGVLYYHDVRGSRLRFKKKWKNIKYEN